MIRFEYEESINASPSDVFAVMSDVARFHEWLDMDGRLVGGDAVGTGARFESTGNLGPLKVRGSGEITRYEHDRAFGFTMRTPNAFDFDIEIELAPTATGTRLRGSGTMTTHRLWRLLEPVLRTEVPKGEAREAARLKKLIEAAR